MNRRQDRQFLLFALVLLGVTGLAAGRTPSARVESALGRALNPLHRALTGFGTQVGGMLDGARTLQNLGEQNKQLERENARDRIEMTKIDDLKAENRKLRDLVQFSRQRVDLDLVGASLTGHKSAEEPGNIRHMIRLDVGSDQGVARHMPVADDRGLVGQVTDISTAWSDVLLITDPESRVEGRIQRTGATGIVFGSPTGDLVMRYIPQNAPDAAPEVQPGDLIFTSGLSQRFPAELPIGQVVEVHQSDVETHQEALLRPTVNFNALELVLVVKNWHADAESPSTSAPQAAP